jgi:hypothetical protein
MNRRTTYIQNIACRVFQFTRVDPVDMSQAIENTLNDWMETIEDARLVSIRQTECDHSVTITIVYEYI